MSGEQVEKTADEVVSPQESHEKLQDFLERKDALGVPVDARVAANLLAEFTGSDVESVLNGALPFTRRMDDQMRQQVLNGEDTGEVIQFETHLNQSRENIRVSEEGKSGGQLLTQSGRFTMHAS